MELAVQISTIVTAAGIVFALLTYFVNRKGIYFQTMQRCIMEYRKIMHEHQSNKRKYIKMNTVLQHDLFGLFNEQLFYIRKNYVPKEISIEWLTTIQKALNEMESKYPSIKLDSYERVEELSRLIQKLKTSNEKKHIQILLRKYSRRIFWG